VSDLYMHILDKAPAEFMDGHIVFAGRRVGTLATSLKQIRREQAVDKLWCANRGIAFTDAAYSYIRISRKATKP
jgi:hypothetical protein